MKSYANLLLALWLIVLGAACSGPASQSSLRLEVATALRPLALQTGSLQVVTVDTKDPRYGVFDGADSSWIREPEVERYGAVENYRRLSTPEGIADAVATISATLDSSPAFRTGNGPELMRRMQDQLHELEANARKATTWSDLVDSTFRPQVASAADRVSSTVILNGTPDEFRLRETPMTPGMPAPSPGTPDHYASIEQALEIRAICRIVEDVFAQARQAPLERVTKRLSEINGGWKNYLEHGYSQFPWESYLNSQLWDFAWSEPPRHQLVLLHPELGMLVDTRSSRGSSTATLLVHGIGYIRYGEDRSWFMGLSATGSFATDDAAGMGFGPTLHFGHSAIRSAIPHLSVSVLWHDFDEGGSGPVIAVSMDLWRLVAKDGGEGAFWNELRP
ncbi:MAG: hypothetical protein GC161_04440 [Planctomycetaceae bacterium]|nr:hypothetical protein [Planctomycetaceae bacterium]